MVPVIPFSVLVASIIGPLFSTVFLGTGATYGITQLFKHMIAPTLVQEASKILVGTIGQAIEDGIGGATTNIIETAISRPPRFPSIIAQMPFMAFVPRWALPFSDAALVATLVTIAPLSAGGYVAVAAKMGLGYVFHSIKFGTGAKMALLALHSIATIKFRNGQQHATNLLPNIYPDPGAWVPSPQWFDAIDPTLRVLVQAGFYGCMGFWALKSLGKTPLQGPSIPTIISPPSVKDIIIEQAGSRMASFDFAVMLFMKFGLPFIGVILVLSLGYQYYFLQSTVNAQVIENSALQSTVSAQGIANSSLSSSLANSKATLKVEKARNSQGQFTKDQVSATKIKKVSQLLQVIPLG